MNKKFLLVLTVIILFSVDSFTQELKFRFDIGNSTNFTSYSPKLFNYYRQAPISTSEYTYMKLTRFSLKPNNIGLSVEFDYKERNHFSLGMIYGDIISLKDKVLFNFTLDNKDSVEYVATTPWSIIDDIEIRLHKIGFTYARDFGQGRIRFSPFLGLSYAWVGGGATPNDTIGISGTRFDTDYLYPSSKFYIMSYENFTDHTSTLMGSIGFCLRFHSKNRELFALKIYYEQGFRTMAMRQWKIYRNNKYFLYNLSYSYGSALYLKLSIPIPIYNFTEHKFFR